MNDMTNEDHMNENTDILHEAKRLRLLAAALELQHFTRTAASVTPIPGGDQVVAIGTSAQVRALLAAPAAPEQVQAIPAGYVLMPKRLTAENGAKGALSGEFKESIEVPCPECHDEGDDYECATCENFDRVTQDVPVSWDTVKRIYEAAVHLLSAPIAASPAAPTKMIAMLAELVQAMREYQMDVDYEGPAPGKHRDMMRRAEALLGAAAAPAAPTLTDEEITELMSDIYLSDYYGKGTQAYDIAIVRAALAALAKKTPAAPAAEEVRNQAQVDAIMDAIQHACGELPVGYEVILEMESGAGGVVWTDDEGERHVIDGDGYISQDIHKAVERAIEHAAMKRAASTEGDAA